MDFNIPKILKRIDMAEYTEELSGKFLCVWVNLPLKLLREHAELTRSDPSPDPSPNATHSERGEEEERTRKIYAWYAQVWSQDGDAETHWTAKEIEALNDADPAFVSWMMRETWVARLEHVQKKKQN